MTPKFVAFCALLSLAAPLLAEQEETFTEIAPGLEAADPNKLIPLAEKGDVRAMNNIGLLWARGVGVAEPNFQEALRWWKDAAKRGYPLAMNNIGLLYANGQGVKQDYKEAFKWWEMSSERGNAWAMPSGGPWYRSVRRDEPMHLQSRAHARLRLHTFQRPCRGSRARARLYRAPPCGAAGTMPSFGTGGSAGTGRLRDCPAWFSSTALALMLASTVQGPSRWPGA